MASPGQVASILHPLTLWGGLSLSAFMTIMKRVFLKMKWVALGLSVTLHLGCCKKERGPADRMCSVTEQLERLTSH